jgi:hypothetical protein
MVSYFTVGFFSLDPIDWNMAHQIPNYLDMVRVKYRTFFIEYSHCEVIWIL